MKSTTTTNTFDVNTIIADYKKSLEAKDRAIQIQQAIIENLREERSRLLRPCLN